MFKYQGKDKKYKSFLIKIFPNAGRNEKSKYPFQ